MFFFVNTIGSDHSRNKKEEVNKKKLFHKINYEDSPPEVVTFHINPFLEEYPEFCYENHDKNEINNSYIVGNPNSGPEYLYPANIVSLASLHDPRFEYLNNQNIDFDTRFQPQTKKNTKLILSPQNIIYPYYGKSIKKTFLKRPYKLISRRILRP